MMKCVDGFFISPATSAQPEIFKIIHLFFILNNPSCLYPVDNAAIFSLREHQGTIERNLLFPVFIQIKCVFLLVTEFSGNLTGGDCFFQWGFLFCYSRYVEAFK